MWRPTTERAKCDIKAIVECRACRSTSRSTANTARVACGRSARYVTKIRVRLVTRVRCMHHPLDPFISSMRSNYFISRILRSAVVRFVCRSGTTRDSALSINVIYTFEQEFTTNLRNEYGPTPCVHTYTSSVHPWCITACQCARFPSVANVTPTATKTRSKTIPLAELPSPWR